MSVQREGSTNKTMYGQPGSSCRKSWERPENLNDMELEARSDSKEVTRKLLAVNWYLKLN